jgi:small-conductance mechanosensitive channel
VTLFAPAGVPHGGFGTVGRVSANVTLEKDTPVTGGGEPDGKVVDGRGDGTSALVAKLRLPRLSLRTLVAGALAVVAASVAGQLGGLDADRLLTKLIAVAATLAFLLFAGAFLVGIAGWVRAAVRPRIGEAHAAVVRLVTVIVGGIVVLMVVLGLLSVPLGQLVLGGAFTGVIIGIAGQQSLANLFAGIVLLFARPFMVGDDITLRSGALGGVLEGRVVEIGLTYVRLRCADGPLSLPNSQVLAAAVGPRRH